ncbi:MAG: hypothetical protein PHI05_05075 [Bacilli bacterium]|nr:hypothetical protein [Bacilli bacterium]
MNKADILTAYDLEQFLQKKLTHYKTTNDFANLVGGIIGKYKGFEIKINFNKNDYLIISTNQKSKTILDELVPVLSNAIGNYYPICKYDYIMGDRESMPTIEWDINDPEGRIREIVNGRAFTNGKCLNLSLYGNRNIESYIEDEITKQRKNRIFGIDPGFLKNKDGIDQLSEVDLYFAINNISRMINSTINSAYGNKIDLTEEQYAIEYCAYQTTKFGVEFDKPEPGKHILSTPSYEAWYRFYDNHFNNKLTDAELSEYQINKKQGNDVSNYMPKGNWKDNLPKVKIR